MENAHYEIIMQRFQDILHQNKLSHLIPFLLECFEVPLLHGQFINL